MAAPSPEGGSLERSHQQLERKQAAGKKKVKKKKAWKGSELLNKLLAREESVRGIWGIGTFVYGRQESFLQLAFPLIHPGQEISKAPALLALGSVFSFPPGFTAHYRKAFLGGS